jgi:hypothetical protein
VARLLGGPLRWSAGTRSEIEEAAVAEIHTDGAAQTAEREAVAGTIDETAATVTEPLEAADAQSAAADLPATAWSPTGADMARLATAAGVLLVAAVAVMVRRAGAAVPLERGESLALSVRPRKVLRSYLRSAGLWELDRRATRFTVTDRRLLVEEGLVQRAVTAVPLNVLQHVVLRTGPWQGWVDVAFPSSSGRGVERLGPFRSPVARQFAATLASGGGIKLAEVAED